MAGACGASSAGGRWRRKQRSSNDGQVTATAGWRGRNPTKAGPRFLIKYPVQREDGTKRVVLKRGFITRKDAAAALRAEIRKVEMGEWVEPSKQRLDAYLAEWVQGQRLSPSTVSSYRKSIRLHIDPYLGAVPIARLTGTAVNAWMRTLETSGRADRRGGLSARTVRYVYTILRAALADAVKHGRLSVNPTNRSTPPSPSEARPPEMQAWTARELGRFLRWAEECDRDLAMSWRLLAATGMRRGEALALDTVAALRAYRADRGLLALDLVRDGALVLGNPDGTHRHPERYSRRFMEQVAQARKALGEDLLPRIRLHDLRHTHASRLLAAGEPVKVVSERLGHASATITLTVYQHVHPGMGRQAADRFAALLRG
jgi:integrase